MEHMTPINGPLPLLISFFTVHGYECAGKAISAHE